MEPVADDGGDVLFDIAEALDAHGAEDAEALALEVLEHLPGLLPVVAVGPLPVGIEEDVGLTTRLPTSSNHFWVSVWISAMDRDPPRRMWPQVWLPKVQPVRLSSQ